MDLNHPIWQEINGGYKMPYDASVPLKKLEQPNDLKVIEDVLSELWEELHHQGDVDLASYLALPHLVRIGREKNLFNWNLIGLCATIELARHSNNPPLPVEFEQFYLDGLKNLHQFVLQNLGKATDEETFRVALATIAITTGRLTLGKFIIDASDDEIEEFLER